MYEGGHAAGLPLLCTGWSARRRAFASFTAHHHPICCGHAFHRWLGPPDEEQRAMGRCRAADRSSVAARSDATSL